MGQFAAGVHGHPATKRCTIVGITGTNGKTTTTHLARRRSSSRRRPTGVHRDAVRRRTDAEATELQARLAAFRDDGDAAVVMEVSSHALALHRVAGTLFDVAVFTNLGRDHLDLHESMEAYFRAKASLFDARARRGRRDQRRRSVRPPAARRRRDRRGAVSRSPT